MDVVATHSSSSAPVEVSWSPPTDAAPAIIGYRIFYGSGQNLLVPSYVTSIVFNFVKSNQIESVSIRSESVQLPSELISMTVTIAGMADLSRLLCQEIYSYYRWAIIIRSTVHMLQWSWHCCGCISSGGGNHCNYHCCHSDILFLDRQVYNYVTMLKPSELYTQP